MTGMRMSDPKPTFTALVKSISTTTPHLAYLSLVEPRVSGDDDIAEAKHSEADSNDFLHEIWLPRPVLSGGGLSTHPEDAERVVSTEGVLAVFGRAFLANVSSCVVL